MSKETKIIILENKVRELEFQRNSLQGELIAAQKEVIGLKRANARLNNEVEIATAEIQDLQVNLFLNCFIRCVLILDSHVRKYFSQRKLHE